MALLPSPAAPPAVNWVAAYWADDPANRATPNSPGVPVDKIVPLSGSKALTMWSTSTQRPHLVTESQRLNGRNAWVIDSVTDYIVTPNFAALGQSFSLVAVANIDPWITNAGTMVGAGGAMGFTSSASPVVDASVAIGQSNNTIFARAIPPVNTPILMRSRSNRPTTGQGWIQINGSVLLDGVSGLNNAAEIQTVWMGNPSFACPGHYGFVGVFAGDVTTDPEWANFLTWVQSWYGFDPTAPCYTGPPPVGWRASWWADEYDNNAGIAPDRSGGARGTNLPLTNLGSSTLSSSGINSDGLNATTIGFASQTVLDGPLLLGAPSQFLDVRWRWMPGAAFSGGSIISQWAYGAPAQSGWSIDANNTPTVTLSWYDTTDTLRSATVPPIGPYLGRSEQWWRVLLTFNDGGVYTVKWYTGSNGSDWKLAATNTGGATTDIRATPTTQFAVGGQASSGGNVIYNNHPATYKQVIVSDATGTLIDLDFTSMTPRSRTITEPTTGKRMGMPYTSTYRGQPVRVDNVINGHPVIRFDGTEDGLLGPTINLAAPYSVVMLAKCTTAAANQGLFGGYTNSVILALRTYASGIRSGNNTTYSDVATDVTQWHLYRVYADAAGAVTPVVDETSTGSSAAAALTTLYRAELATNGNFASFAGMDVAFAGVFAGDVTASAQWSAFKTWINSYYGLSLP